MSMYVERVKTGAAATRRAGIKDPMALLAKLREQDPTDSYERITAKWKKLVENDSDYFDTALLYAARNYWTAIDRDSRQQAAATPQAVQAAAVRKEKEQANVQVLVAAVKQRVLLDMTLSNGKKLRFCTGNECKAEGGWLTKVGKRAGSKLVGEVLSEQDLQDLML